MTEPIFPEVVIGPLAYTTIGLLIATIIFLLAYIYRMKNSDEMSDLDVKQLNMAESRLTILEKVLNENTLQNRLPEKTGYSKSTVSQAIKELRDKDFVKKKKRGNSYLIEPNIEKIEEEIERL